MPVKRIEAVFYRTATGVDVVLEWLRSLSKEERRAIGDDLRRIEFRWPIGMPLSRPLGDGLHELRSRLPTDRISRLIFFISADEDLVVLHGFIKKTQKTPPRELALARKLRREYEEQGP